MSQDEEEWEVAPLICPKGHRRTLSILKDSLVRNTYCIWCEEPVFFKRVTGNSACPNGGIVSAKTKTVNVNKRIGSELLFENDIFGKPKLHRSRIIDVFEKKS